MQRNALVATHGRLDLTPKNHSYGRLVISSCRRWPGPTYCIEFRNLWTSCACVSTHVCGWVAGWTTFASATFACLRSLCGRQFTCCRWKNSFSRESETTHRHLGRLWRRRSFEHGDVGASASSFGSRARRFCASSIRRRLWSHHGGIGTRGERSTASIIYRSRLWH